MKLLTSLLFLLIVITLPCFSQSRSTIGLSIGAAIPVGEFAKTDNNDEKSGLARLGAMANLTYMRSFGESDFGFAASLRARWNPINTQSALGSLRDAYPGFEWESKKASWKSAALMAGVYRDFHFIKNVLVNTTVLLGASESELPAFTIVGAANSASFPGTMDAVFVSSNKRYSTAFSGSFQIGVSGQ